MAKPSAPDPGGEGWPGHQSPGVPREESDGGAEKAEDGVRGRGSGVRLQGGTCKPLVIGSVLEALLEANAAGGQHGLQRPGQQLARQPGKEGAGRCRRHSCVP